MKEIEVKRKSFHWRIILAFCLVSLAAVSCSSIEKTFKPTPTVPPTPTTFPAYKYFFPIPLVKQFTDPEKVCEQKHFETYDTTTTILGSYPGSELSPNSQVAEISYRQFPRPTTETTTVIFPQAPAHRFSIVADDLDSITVYQITPACDQNRVKAEWFQKAQIDNLYSADIPNRKYLPIKKQSRLAEATLRAVTISSHSNPNSATIVPMEIVP